MLKVDEWTNAATDALIEGCAFCWLEDQSVEAWDDSPYWDYVLGD